MIKLKNRFIQLDLSIIFAHIAVEIMDLVVKMLEEAI